MSLDIAWPVNCWPGLVLMTDSQSRKWHRWLWDLGHTDWLEDSFLVTPLWEMKLSNGVRRLRQLHSRILIVSCASKQKVSATLLFTTLTFHVSVCLQWRWHLPVWLWWFTTVVPQCIFVLRVNMGVLSVFINIYHGHGAKDTTSTFHMKLDIRHFQFVWLFGLKTSNPVLITIFSLWLWSYQNDSSFCNLMRYEIKSCPVKAGGLTTSQMPTILPRIWDPMSDHTKGVCHK